MLLPYLLILTTPRENRLQEFGSLRRSPRTSGDHDQCWARHAFVRRGSLRPLRLLVLYGQFRLVVLDLYNHLFLGAWVNSNHSNIRYKNICTLIKDVWILNSALERSSLPWIRQTNETSRSQIVDAFKMWCVIKLKSGLALQHITITKRSIWLRWMSQYKYMAGLLLMRRFTSVEQLNFLSGIKVYISVAGDRDT